MTTVGWDDLAEVAVETRSGVMRGRIGGDGPIMVFVHGNPTSGFLWRKVVPLLTRQFRCVVLDLIGLGRSDLPAVALTIPEHAAALDDALAAFGVGSATLVGHDWGAVLALDHAARHPEHGHRVAGCEGHLRPIESWAETDTGFQELFSQLRDPQEGHRLVVEENMFVTDVLLGSLPWLNTTEQSAYLGPSLQRQTRETIWQLIRSIPIAGEPPEALAVMGRVHAALANQEVPVLLLCGDPGSVVGSAVVDWARGFSQSLDVAQVGAGAHFLPEEQPEAIAEALAQWI